MCSLTPKKREWGAKGFSNAEGGTQNVFGKFLHGNLKF